MPFKPYETKYYCRKCEEWIDRDKAERNSGGAPICPICHNPLRIKARRPYQRNLKQTTLDKFAEKVKLVARSDTA